MADRPALVEHGTVSAFRQTLRGSYRGSDPGFAVNNPHIFLSVFNGATLAYLVKDFRDINTTDKMIDGFASLESSEGRPPNYHVDDNKERE